MKATRILNNFLSISTDSTFSELEMGIPSTQMPLNVHENPNGFRSVRLKIRDWKDGRSFGMSADFQLFFNLGCLPTFHSIIRILDACSNYVWLGNLGTFGILMAYSITDT